MSRRWRWGSEEIERKLFWDRGKRLGFIDGEWGFLPFQEPPRPQEDPKKSILFEIKECLGQKCYQEVEQCTQFVEISAATKIKACFSFKINQ